MTGSPWENQKKYMPNKKQAVMCKQGCLLLWCRKFVSLLGQERGNMPLLYT